METKKPNTTLTLPDGRTFEGQPLGMTVSPTVPATTFSHVVVGDACGHLGRLLSNFTSASHLAGKHRASKMLLDALSTHLALLTRQDDIALATQLIAGFRATTTQLEEWLADR